MSIMRLSNGFYAIELSLENLLPTSVLKGEIIIY